MGIFPINIFKKNRIDDAVVWSVCLVKILFFQRKAADTIKCTFEKEKRNETTSKQILQHKEIAKFVTLS